MLRFGLRQRLYAVHLLLVEVAFIIVTPQDNFGRSLDDEIALVTRLTLAHGIVTFFDELVFEALRNILIVIIRAVATLHKSHMVVHELFQVFHLGLAALLHFRLKCLDRVVKVAQFARNLELRGLFISALECAHAFHL